tara:strand:- start:11621 stop:12922 length:1302 start_codon:yes stop_codon:yes gene_type:complete
MSGFDIDEGTGAGGTATGPKVAKADGPATSDNVNGQLPPDDNPPSDVVSIDGADLLNRALVFIQRFVILPSDHAGVSLVLWAGHAHLMGAWETTPRLAFLSAEAGSGKSLAMRLTALLSPLALEAASATTSSLIRALDDPDGRPSYFIDEIDTRYGPNAKGDEQLRCMINAGHQIDGYIMRNEQVNNDWYPVRKSAFAAVAMAGIGNILPDTILTRSIVVKMRKRLPGEEVESYRRRDHKPIGDSLCRELAAWADQICEAAAVSRPVLPDGIADRDADVWEPLIVIADLAGGQWPALARQAAIDTVQSAKANNRPSLGVQLLVALKGCFEGQDRISTADVLMTLLADEEAPWGSLGRKGLDPRTLAEMLREFGIQPHPMRLTGSGSQMLRGYFRADFKDAWARYLPASEKGVTDVISVNEQEGFEKIGHEPKG